MKNQRATVIVRNANGWILLTQMRDDFWLLPGGRIEYGEEPQAAARRELQEETGLVAADMRFLFKHESMFTVHHVFEAIGCDGEPSPCNEIERVTWVPAGIGAHMGRDWYHIYDSSIEIIRRVTDYALAATS